MLREATIKVLQQLTTLIQGVGESYTHESVDRSSTIGQHVRHMLDHFTALKAAAATGHVNYNNRNRNSILELEPNAALMQIEHLIGWIKSDELEDYAITVESEVSISQCDNIVVDTSFHREICYVINHTVHHIAYATLLARQLGLSLDASLGVAPATATYRRSQRSTLIDSISRKHGERSDLGTRLA